MKCVICNKPESDWTAEAKRLFVDVCSEECREILLRAYENEDGKGQERWRD